MSRRRTASRSVPVVYGTVAGFLIAVIAALALIFVPPSPPSVSEFAPQATEDIRDAPEDQSSQFGEADGACVAGQPCDEAGRAGDGPLFGGRRVIDKARVRRCPPGDPPRQIEDPQAPPCVNYWEGDNGGATSKGVTGLDIRVAVAENNDPRGTRPNHKRVADAFISFFNKRFEFYGRKLSLHFYVPPQTEFRHSDNHAAEIGKPSTQQALAKDLDDNRIFAAVGSPYRGTHDARPFFNELARLKIIGVHPGDPWRQTQSYRANAPFLWAYGQPLDYALDNLGEFACKSLQGNAEFAGPPANLQPRFYGIVLPEFPAGRPDPSPLPEHLTRCNMKHRTYSWDTTSQGLLRLIAVMRSDGISTIVCLCQFLQIDDFDNKIAQDRWQVEFLLAGIASQDEEKDWSYLPDGGNATYVKMFGLGATNKHVPYNEGPAFWALSEMMPEGTPPSAETHVTYVRDIYQGMLLLASGIQAAGPTLTPQNFERGLRGLKFPNPGAGARPYYQGRVGFGGGDYTMLQDYPLMWKAYSRLEHNPSLPQSGAWCYIAQGARWSKGSWPAGRHPFFSEAESCR